MATRVEPTKARHYIYDEKLKKMVLAKETVAKRVDPSKLPEHLRRYVKAAPKQSKRGKSNRSK
jgi:hypothetical protein